MICSKCHKEHQEKTKQCNDCKERDRNRRKKDPEKFRERDRLRREKDPEKYNQKTRTHRQNNLEKVRESDRLRNATRTRKLYEIKRSALKRNISFQINDEDAMAMTDLDCFYCGIENTEIRRNGIDRLDNTKPYTTDNCVSCCGTCNLMKHCLDAKTFVERCSQISLHNGGEGKMCDYWDDIKGYSFSQYQSVMKKYGFDITKEEYEMLRLGNCTYCGRSCTATHTNGIDRLDSSKGYILANCVTCCGSCNISKKTMSSEDFINKCQTIASKTFALPNIPRCVHIFKKNRPVVSS